MSERSTTSSTTYLEALGGRAAPPSIQRLATIAYELSEKLRSVIVFIGVAILPLLETD